MPFISLFSDRFKPLSGGIDAGMLPTPTPTPTNTPTLSATMTPTPTLSPTMTLTPTPSSPDFYYYSTNAYQCDAGGCIFVSNTYVVKSSSRLTIGYFYNNPGNRGYSFEILSEISYYFPNLDLSSEPGYSDCLTSCYGPTPTNTPTPTTSGNGVIPGQHVFIAQTGIPWNGYGGNYLSFGYSQEGINFAPQAGWYFIDSNGNVRRLLNNPLWFSGGNPSPYRNGNGWMAVSNASFYINPSQTTITFYETSPV